MCFLIYTIKQIQEGHIMNEFENNPAKKTNDVPHAIQGFVYSLVFFMVIFVIGSAISFIN